ncbi:hypothetical protein KAU11_11130 [Candidatus Babeliales bacterium]|nr:hypothetical protein [Candidatus Babeliales bacterium]
MESKPTVEEVIEASDRAKEKHEQRQKDQRDLDAGKITKQQLRERNGHFDVDATIEIDQEDF